MQRADDEGARGVKIHTISSQPHYLQHLEAIHRHLPDSLRGERRHGAQVSDRLMADDDIVIVAGAIDIGKVKNLNRRIVYLEHGAGQRYQGLPAWAEMYYGALPDRVSAYLGPRPNELDRDIPGFAIGAPICDPYEWYGEENVAVITFHWAAPRVAAQVPEAGSTFEHYVDQLPAIVSALRNAGHEVLGHRHPRFTHLRSVWRNLNVPEVDADTVRRRAKWLIADNTSLAYEMQYVGRSVVSLDAPWYRRDVEHGLRFWSHVPGGETMSGPDQLLDEITTYGLPGRSSDDLAQNEHVYGRRMNDGNDGLRAACWLAGYAHRETAA